MDRKLRFVNNERLDLPDATAIHDLVDASFRALGRIEAAAGAGLTISGAYAPPGVVVSGWTVRVNPGNDQQVLITPGTAYCEQMVDGAAVFGQLTAPSATELTYTLSAPLQPYGLWIRFDYAAADTENRALWNLASSPPAEVIQPVLTRMRAIALVSKGDLVTPPDSNGWFKIADVDYTAGIITAGDIDDRRALLFEGQASGTANPATTWDVPDFNRGNSRSTIGSASTFGALMRIYRRLIEVSGRSQWYAAPTYGENTRSASAMITGGDANEVPHVTISTTPTPAALGDFLSGANQPDQRSAVCLIPGLLGLNASFAVDTTAASVTLTATKRMHIIASADIRRTAGTLPLVVTSGFDGTVTSLGIVEDNAIGDPVLSLASANDDLILDGCRFTANSGAQGVLVDVAAAGRYVFRNCTFAGTGTSTTSLVRINQSATVIFEGCTFTAGLFAVNVPNAGKDSTVSIVGGTFAGCGTVFRDEAGTCNLSWQGVGISGTVTADSAITGLTSFAANALNKSSRTYDRQVARTVWAQANQVRFGNDADPAFVTTAGTAAGQLTGQKAAAGGRLDALFRYYYADGGRFIFGDGSSSIDSRFQKTGNAVSLLDSASTDVATSNYMHTLGVHYGPLTNPRGYMGAQQVLMGWGELYYASGDGPTTFQCLWHDANGTTNLQATGDAALFFDGTNDYHRWQIAPLPGSVGVGGTGSLRNYNVVASLTSTSPGDFAQAATGLLDYTAEAFVFLKASTSFSIIPILRANNGNISGFRAVDAGAANYTFTPASPGSYVIQWAIYADPTEVV